MENKNRIYGILDAKTISTCSAQASCDEGSFICEIVEEHCWACADMCNPLSDITIASEEDRAKYCPLEMATPGPMISTNLTEDKTCSFNEGLYLFVAGFSTCMFYVVLYVLVSRLQHRFKLNEKCKYIHYPITCCNKRTSHNSQRSESEKQPLNPEQFNGEGAEEVPNNSKGDTSFRTENDTTSGTNKKIKGRDKSSQRESFLSQLRCFKSSTNSLKINDNEKKTPISSSEYTQSQTSAPSHTYKVHTRNDTEKEIPGTSSEGCAKHASEPQQSAQLKHNTQGQNDELQQSKQGDTTPLNTEKGEYTEHNNLQEKKDAQHVNTESPAIDHKPTDTETGLDQTRLKETRSDPLDQVQSIEPADDVSNESPTLNPEQTTKTSDMRSESTIVRGRSEGEFTVHDYESNVHYSNQYETDGEIKTEPRSMICHPESGLNSADGNQRDKNQSHSNEYPLAPVHRQSSPQQQQQNQGPHGNFPRTYCIESRDQSQLYSQLTMREQSSSPHQQQNTVPLENASNGVRQQDSFDSAINNDLSEATSAKLSMHFANIPHEHPQHQPHNDATQQLISSLSPEDIAYPKVYPNPHVAAPAMPQLHMEIQGSISTRPSSHRPREEIPQDESLFFNPIRGPPGTSSQQELRFSSRETRTLLKRQEDNRSMLPRFSELNCAISDCDISREQEQDEESNMHQTIGLHESYIMDINPSNRQSSNTSSVSINARETVELTISSEDLATNQQEENSIPTSLHSIQRSEYTESDISNQDRIHSVRLVGPINTNNGPHHDRAHNTIDLRTRPPSSTSSETSNPRESRIRRDQRAIQRERRLMDEKLLVTIRRQPWIINSYLNRNDEKFRVFLRSGVSIQYAMREIVQITGEPAERFKFHI